MRLFTVRVFFPLLHTFFFSYIASDHVYEESTYVDFFITSWFGSLISNYFTLDLFFIISTYKPHTVETFHCSCIFPLLHTFFPYFHLFFQISAHFFKFPPIFHISSHVFIYCSGSCLWGVNLLYMTSWSIDFNSFISCNTSTVLNRVVWSLKRHVLSEECDLFADAEDRSRHMSRKTSMMQWCNHLNTMDWPS